MKNNAPKHYYLARHPWVGVLMFLVGGFLFALLAYNVRTQGPLLQWDIPISQALHVPARHGPWLLLQAMRFGSFLGREMAIILTAIFGVYWFGNRRWRELTMILVGTGGGELMFETLSRFFNRPRPYFPDPIDPLPGPGFPSGHSISAVILYGLLAYLIVPQLAQHGKRLAVILLTLLVMVYIGFSRVYIGNHYLTDVLAGYSLGIAWFGLAYTLVELAFAGYGRRHPVKLNPFPPLERVPKNLNRT